LFCITHLSLQRFKNHSSRHDPKSKDALSPKLIEEILQHADGQELFGVQGFFQRLKRGLVNGMLEG